MSMISAAHLVNQEPVRLYRSVIDKVKDDGADYAVVDYPDYNNIGDSAIWAGQSRILREVFGKKPAYVACPNDYKGDIEDFSKNFIVFVQGGGNFGDIWKSHQDFRIGILERYSNKKVVQLPQSIFFSSPHELDLTKRAIGRHGDFHLLVRDQASFLFAKAEFDCPVHLCPDAAHSIPFYISEPAQHEVFSLVRTDIESDAANLEEIVREYGPVQDWNNIDGYFYKNEGVVNRFFRRHIQYKFPTSSLMMAYRRWMYDHMAKRAVDRGIKQLSQGEIVISDRLHAHILCTLIGKPHISLDNANGKIGEYIRQWGGFGITELAGSPADIKGKMEKLRNLLSRAEAKLSH